MSGNSTSTLTEYSPTSQFLALCVIAAGILVVGALCRLAPCRQLQESCCSRH